ncbi:N-acetyl-beta-glucosaminyl-glycoprotein 4-beta-N-acetylgalactosaminyltransferase 1-like isoform X1 [Acipenser ruthenus]|uniref:N-acetyl-beta-glucosaminyl-glycoprotein 4-beta-N-acetylgalactosaminyltransferase 1-like isoform X1 n=1 Tax=Acipenser ruthenus TaxID=7906 RepID=UPI00274246DB|nr:N-acetyl-beta-glucosaminyl-glycoprotein 4-beta-N-acetylgalactosaminyltransferase 1-like isoform X1 [Acipenser ruthenus]
MIKFFLLKKLNKHFKFVFIGCVVVVGLLATYLEYMASVNPHHPRNPMLLAKEVQSDQQHSKWKNLEQSWSPEFRGQVNLHIFEDWCGSTVEQLRKNLHFPLYPHKRTMVRKLAVAPRWKDYGLRLFGYIHPYEEGEFQFAVASDDNSEFWLSRNEKPEELQLLAFVGKRGREWTAPGEFEKYPSQISQPVHLSMKRYYFEVLHKQDGGGTDHVEVAWRLRQAGSQFTLISSRSLSLYTNESSLLLDEVLHIPQSPASHRRASWHSTHTAEMLKSDPRDSFHLLPFINESHLEQVLPDCIYSPSYLVSPGYTLVRYQGLHFVHLSYVYPNDYTRLTHMEAANKCFYHRDAYHSDSRSGFSRFMRMDPPKRSKQQKMSWVGRDREVLERKRERQRIQGQREKEGELEVQRPRQRTRVRWGEGVKEERLKPVKRVDYGDPDISEHRRKLLSVNASGTAGGGGVPNKPGRRATATPGVKPILTPGTLRLKRKELARIARARRLQTGQKMVAMGPAGKGQEVLFSWPNWEQENDGNDMYMKPVLYDQAVDWEQTFNLMNMDFADQRSDWIDLNCNVSGNLILSEAEALGVVQSYMEKLNARNKGLYSLKRVVNVEKRLDPVKGSRYLLDLELLEGGARVLRLSQFVFVLNPLPPVQWGSPWLLPRPAPPPPTEPQLCRPQGLTHRNETMVHFIVPVKDQARWVQQFITDMEELYRETRDENFNIIITDYSSTDMDVERALRRAALPRFQYVKLKGNFKRSVGLQSGINLIQSNSSIVFLCDLHLHFPTSILDSIRKHCVEGRLAFAPIVLRMDCGASIQEPDGYWEVNGFGLLALYKSDLDSVGGMNTREFQDSWGGEDWELLDRIVQAGLEVERIYLRKFFHHFHSKRGMWNRILTEGNQAEGPL